MNRFRWLLASMIPAIAIIAVGESHADPTENLPPGAVVLRGKKPGRDYREGEIIIKYKHGVASADAAKATTLSRVHAQKIRELDHSSEFVHARLPAGKTVAETMVALASDPNVEYVQPNYLYHTTATTPNDPSFGQLWGLKNTGQTITSVNSASIDSTNNPPGVSTTGMDMDLTDAWDLITDCRGAGNSVIVAVIDTGIKYDHADLSANMWASGDVTIPNHGWNVITGAASANDPMDDNGHGTHVAGTIGAVGNNGVGTTGVCWTTQLMAIKALDSTGSGSTADIANGITWATNHGAKVINMSLGGAGNDPAMSNAISTAAASGVVVVVAAGNNGSNNDSTPTYPCNFGLSNMVCVAALNQGYGLASFSNYGSTSVNVAAPGTNIVSTWPFTVTAVTDNFSAGWTYAPVGGWGLATLSSGGVNYPSLVDPTNWDGSSSTYAANADHHVYKTFNLTGIFKANLAYELHYDTQASVDLFKIYEYGSGGDPVTSGTVIDQDSGTGAYYNSELPLDSSCLTATCSIGLRFTSDASIQKTGIALLKFQINKSVYSTTSYNVIEGTSMATPHVAGLAAMLLAYNPSFTYSDVVSVIKNSGPSVSALSGKTSTGKAVNAMNALAYIQAPTGVAAVAQ